VTDRYFCEVCQTRYDIAGDCPNDPDEPLQDLADEDVRNFLQSRDDAAWRKRSGLFATIAGFVSFVPAILIAGWVSSITRSGIGRNDGSVAIGAFVGIFGAGVAGSGAMLMAMFPPKKIMPLVDDYEIDRWNAED